MKTDLPGCDNAVPICDTRIADVSCVMRRSGQSFIINPSDVTVVVSCCVYSASVVVRAFAYRGQVLGPPEKAFRLDLALGADSQLCRLRRVIKIGRRCDF